MAVRTWVGRFTVVDGHVQEEGPWLGSLIRQRTDDEPDELYVLIESAAPGKDEYTAQLVDVIARLYNRDALSLTGALVRSMKAAHEHLRDWNQKSLQEHRVGAGASCLTMRGSDAYLAQAGPSLAYVRSADGAFRRIMAPNASFEHALGIADPFEPQLTRLPLAPGDLVLLASTALDEIVPADHVRRILDRGADEALPELYLLCRDRPQFSLLLLSCFEPEVDAPPDFLTHRGESAPEPTDEPPAALAAVLPMPEPAGVAPGPARASLAVGSFDLPRRPIADQVREITASTAPSPATGVRLRGDSATPRYKRSTGAGMVPQFRVPKLALFGALALVVLGLVAWMTIPGRVKQDREARFTTLVGDARESNARAQATGDPGLKRNLLTAAQTDLVDAAKIHPDNGEVVALKSDVASAIAVLDAVYEIKDWTTVADLSQQVTGSLSITRAVVGGDNAYFLDVRGHRVLRLPLDGSAPPETILQDGALAGFATSGRPVQIAWSEQSGSLLMIDDKRQAFAYFPGDGKRILPLTVRGSDGWGSVDAITASGGNLYLLDVKGNQVWRYLPGEGGFDSERTGLLEQADLTNATELAVGQDVYVLDAQAGIRRFVGKTETPFPLAGIDMPLVSPAALSVLPGSNRLVVADRGNKRVVLASPEGAFLRQIVSPAFTDLRSVSVDEGKNIIYVLNGDTLMKAAFPP
jgi:serine/threonine protein phosphatase PrpC